ncbi:lysostaphin resistance A-like protein [Halostagnicola sp. A-GB9-2]|uniref:CPBP family intramembrane glutamic endopeptidase n=1 Tax=Halostagnicola sp. A-GB9-2 TaxID=3048066 RepID=UPI0024C089FA|nr:lysostaphin resistance A-like protein [Halostagnicola sp. A-GB9-2]MDJ1430821.1 CPBP family intramembrane metalloprotease [Halostagnicola sp. A-GB9-2]
MSRTAQADDGGSNAGADGVPAVGTIVATLAMVCLLVPIRQGVDEPAVWAGAVFAVLSVGGFLARRHDILERRVGGPITIGSSALVLVCSAGAIMLGTSGSVILPELGWSISLVFGSFLTGATALAVAVADYAGISGSGLSRRTARFLEMGALGFVGLLAIEIVLLFVALPVLAVVGELTELQAQAISYVSFGLGLGTVAVGYLALRGYDLSYIDIEVPTLRTVGWTILGLILIFGANIAVSVLMTGAGVDSAEHSTSAAVEQNVELVLVIIPAMVLIVGPLEELLYRNVIQKRLYDTFSRYGAVIVASVVFTAVHVGAYATAGAGEVLASLAGVFALSLVLGTIYERTDNLVVPALVHGSYNALLFVPFLL